jgi:hypothetical protein
MGQMLGHRSTDSGQPMEVEVAPVSLEGGGRLWREHPEPIEMERVRMAGEAAGHFFRERGHAIERQGPVVGAEGCSRRGREGPQAVKRQAAPLVPREHLGDRIRDRRQPVEIEVATMSGEFLGHRQREPEQAMQVEIGLAAGDDVGTVLGAGSRGQRDAAVCLHDDPVGLVTDEPLAVMNERSGKRLHEPTGPRGVEVAEAATEIVKRRARTRGGHGIRSRDRTGRGDGIQRKLRPRPPTPFRSPSGDRRTSS